MGTKFAPVYATLTFAPVYATLTFAPVYATLTIGYLEEKLYTIIETNYDTEFQRYLKILGIFLDDCLVPWTKLEE